VEGQAISVVVDLICIDEGDKDTALGVCGIVEGGH
jgi:hypothetical protein